jgi:hypothetical protein
MYATGSATAKEIQAIEYIRKRIKNLHVAYHIMSTEFIDEFQPIEEGLDKVEVSRLVPTLKADLTLTEGISLQRLPGYMPPLPVSELLDEEKFKQEI